GCRCRAKPTLVGCADHEGGAASNNLPEQVREHDFPADDGAESAAVQREQGIAVTRKHIAEASGDDPRPCDDALEWFIFPERHERDLTVLALDRFFRGDEEHAVVEPALQGSILRVAAGKLRILGTAHQEDLPGLEG